MNSSMPTEDQDRVEALMKELKSVQLSILQEETRAKILAESRQNSEVELKNLEGQNRKADDDLAAALAEKKLLQETLVQLTESCKSVSFLSPFFGIICIVLILPI
jgi:uncharacterized protein (DUF3084 family)